MELAHLITALSDPAAYPWSIEVESVDVRQTHISVVFLAGPYAYKLKKPLALGFLDYSTPERRRHFCEQEVSLNRRLAPTVYLGVVPVTSDATGVKMEGPGTVIEWAVKMVRLPDEATLRERLRRGELAVEPLEALARRIAAFHARAEAGPGDRGLWPLRGGGRQRPRELQPIGVPCRHDAQPDRVRAFAGEDGIGPHRAPAGDRAACGAGYAP